MWNFYRQETGIRQDMEEQMQGSGQIPDAVTKLVEIIREVQTSSTEMQQGATEVMNEIEILKRTTKEITGGVEEITSGVREITLAVSQVNDLSGKTGKVSCL